MLKRVDELLDKLLELGVPGYTCIIHKDGKRIYERSGGYSDLATRTPMKGDEVYYMYSCSKMITCTAALMLLERGLFSLDDPVSKYMPEIGEIPVAEGDTTRPAKTVMTVADLFTMTTGFGYNTVSDEMKEFKRDTDGKCPTALFTKYLSRIPLAFDPGERFLYSFSHDVLAALVEKLSGVRFSRFVDENIFKPCGMKNSTFDPMNPLRDRVCTQYRRNAETNAIEPDTNNTFILGTEYESGGAGCISTCEDFSAFLEALRTYKLLKPETIRMMTTDRVSDRRGTLWMDDYGYGLGVRCPRADRDRSDGIFDYGWGGAAGSYLAIDVDNGISISYTQHVLNSPGIPEKRQIVRIATEEILGIKLGTGKADESGVTLA